MSEPLKAEPDCVVCGLKANFSCTGCLNTHYCGKACQKKHWSEHKGPCKSSPIYLKNQEVAKLKKTIKEQEVSLGVEHEDTLASVNDLGLLFQDQGKLAEAEPFYRRALEGRERTRRSGPSKHPCLGQQPRHAAASSGEARRGRALLPQGARGTRTHSREGPSIHPYLGQQPRVAAASSGPQTSTYSNQIK